MSEEPQEHSVQVQLDSTTTENNAHSSLLFDSVDSKEKDLIGANPIVEKWLYLPVAGGIIIALAVVLVITFVPIQQRPWTPSVNVTKESDEVTPAPPPENTFAKQSSTVQDQLMHISHNIPKHSLVSPNTSPKTMPIIHPNAPAAFYLNKSMPHVPVLLTSLPTTSQGPNPSNTVFPTVYHPEQQVLVTKPVIQDQYNISNYGTYQLTIYSEDSTHIIAETLVNVIPQIEICVPRQFIVRDSVNNLLTNAIVTLKDVEENIVAFTSTTNEHDSVNIPDHLADGAYEVEIYSPNNSKLQHLKLVMVVFQNRRQGKTHSFLGRDNLKPNEIEIVLKWAAKPRDLDSHLYASDGRHTYFRNKNETNMSLDYDVLFGYGPETIRFTVESNMKYVYAVHRFSTDSVLTHSKAELMFSMNTQTTQITKFGTHDKLTTGEKLNIPEITRPHARLWIVFMIDGSTKQIKFFDNLFDDNHDYSWRSIDPEYFTI